MFTDTQTFTVTPADLSVVGTENSGAAETEVEYTVSGFGDVEEMRIDLADAADVTIDGGTVSFEGVGARNPVAGFMRRFRTR